MKKKSIIFIISMLIILFVLNISYNTITNKDNISNLDQYDEKTYAKVMFCYKIAEQAAYIMEKKNEGFTKSEIKEIFIIDNSDNDILNSLINESLNIVINSAYNIKMIDSSNFAIIHLNACLSSQ
jgi:hypothetical protein